VAPPILDLIETPLRVPQIFRESSANSAVTEDRL
jgi:hypothetical protein